MKVQAICDDGFIAIILVSDQSSFRDIFYDLCSLRKSQQIDEPTDGIPQSFSIQIDEPGNGSKKMQQFVSPLLQLREVLHTNTSADASTSSNPANNKKKAQPKEQLFKVHFSGFKASKKVNALDDLYQNISRFALANMAGVNAIENYRLTYQQTNEIDLEKSFDGNMTMNTQTTSGSAIPMSEAKKSGNSSVVFKGLTDKIANFFQEVHQAFDEAVSHNTHFNQNELVRLRRAKTLFLAGDLAGAISALDYPHLGENGRASSSTPLLIANVPFYSTTSVAVPMDVDPVPPTKAQPKNASKAKATEQSKSATAATTKPPQATTEPTSNTGDTKAKGNNTSSDGTKKGPAAKKANETPVSTSATSEKSVDKATASTAVAAKPSTAKASNSKNDSNKPTVASATGTAPASVKSTTNTATASAIAASKVTPVTKTVPLVKDQVTKESSSESSSDSESSSGSDSDSDSDSGSSSSGSSSSGSDSGSDSDSESNNKPKAPVTTKTANTKAPPTKQPVAKTAVASAEKATSTTETKVAPAKSTAKPATNTSAKTTAKPDTKPVANTAGQSSVTVVKGAPPAKVAQSSSSSSSSGSDSSSESSSSGSSSSGSGSESESDSDSDSEMSVEQASKTTTAAPSILSPNKNKPATATSLSPKKDKVAEITDLTQSSPKVQSQPVQTKNTLSEQAQPLVIELDVTQSQESSLEIPLILSQMSAAPTSIVTKPSEETKATGPVAFVPGVGVLPRDVTSNSSKPTATTAAAKPVDEKFINELFSDSLKGSASASGSDSDTDSGSESDDESTSSSNSNKLTESTGVKKSKNDDFPLSQNTLTTSEKPAAPAALKSLLINPAASFKSPSHFLPQNNRVPPSTVKSTKPPTTSSIAEESDSSSSGSSGNEDSSDSENENGTDKINKAILPSSSDSEADSEVEDSQATQLPATAVAALDSLNTSTASNKIPTPKVRTRTAMQKHQELKNAAASGKKPAAASTNASNKKTEDTSKSTGNTLRNMIETGSVSTGVIAENKPTKPNSKSAGKRAAGAFTTPVAKKLKK